jgi:hypothetical protein
MRVQCYQIGWHGAMLAVLLIVMGLEASHDDGARPIR